MSRISPVPDKTKDQRSPSQQLRSPIVNILESQSHPSSMRIQDLPISQIEIPLGQRPLRNLTGLVASIQRERLIYPIVVTRSDSHYRLVDGWFRINAYIRLGWFVIPAIVLSVDDQRAELITIDANLMRQELTSAERDELRQRRKEIRETLPHMTPHGTGGWRGQSEARPEESNAPAADTPSNTARTAPTIHHRVPVDTDDQDQGGGIRGRPANLAVVGSRDRRACIPRLVKRLFRIQDPQHNPSGSSPTEEGTVQHEVSLQGKRTEGHPNRGRTPRKAQPKA